MQGRVSGSTGEGAVTAWRFRLVSVVLLSLAMGACDLSAVAPSDPAIAPAAEGRPAREGTPGALDRMVRGDVYVVLLGSGTPIPHPDRSRSAAAVIAGDRAYLVDLGSGVVESANAANVRGIEALNVARLSIAFVTHLHSDHITGYPDLIVTPAILGRREPLRVFGPPGLRKVTDHFLAAFEEDFEHRVAIQQDAPGSRVEVTEITPGKIYKDFNVEVTAFPVVHGTWAHAFGFRFDTPARSLVFSGDTAPTDAVVDACRGCDVLVHEVYCAEGLRSLSRSPQFRSYNRRSHTSATELGEIAARARPKLLVLTHQLRYGCSAEMLVSEIRKAFDGEVMVGEDLGVY